MSLDLRSGGLRRKRREVILSIRVKRCEPGAKFAVIFPFIPSVLRIIIPTNPPPPKVSRDIRARVVRVLSGKILKNTGIPETAGIPEISPFMQGVLSR